MHRSTKTFLLPLFVLTLLSGACGDNNSTTPPPTAPDPVVITRSFSGTLNRNGAITHDFIVERGTTIQARLITVAPNADVAIGMSLGTWNGLVCQIVLANDNAQQGVTVTGSTSTSGSLCVRTYDVGKLTEPTSYQIEVSHF